MVNVILIKEGDIMKKVIFTIIVLLATILAYSIDIELTNGSLLTGKLEKVEEGRIYISRDDILINIDTKVIQRYYSTNTEINYTELQLHKYEDIDFSKFREELVIDENYLENEKILDYINSSILRDIRDTYKNFVKLENGEIIYGDVVLKKSILAPQYFLLDNKREIPYDDVNSYKNDDGYYQAIPYFFTTKTFAKRIRKGKIDLFSKVSVYTTPGTFNTISTPGGNFTNFSPEYTYSTRVDYFRKANGILQKANYSNLKLALSDNPKSMEYLKQYHNLDTFQWITAISAIGFFIGGISQIDKEEGMSSGGKALLGVSCFSAMITWIPHFMKPGKLESAIEEYNK
jgi:hypothetical protein